MVMVPSLFQVQVNLQVLLAILVVARELLIEVLPAMVQIQDEKELVVLGVVVNNPRFKRQCYLLYQSFSPQKRLSVG
jgi:hypothetical protein